MTTCYFQGKFRLSQAFFSVRLTESTRLEQDFMVRPFITLQSPDPDAAPLLSFNDMFAGAAAKPLWRAGATLAHPTATNTCTNRMPHALP